MDQIFALQQVFEKYMRVGKKVYCASAVLEKTYDKVNRNKLWEVLKKHEVEEWVLNSIKAVYDGGKACVRVNDVLSNWL